MEKYPDVKIISNFNELFALPDLDLIVITTPNELHYSNAKIALENGKNVVVDKPFVIKYEEGLDLIRLAKEKNLFLSVYQNRRWDNGFLTLKKYLNENILGDIYNYEAYFDRYRPNASLTKWREQNREGSGILYDLGSHLIDQALTIFGMPSEIFADLEMQRESSQTIDYFKLILKYNKLRVTLGSSSIMPLPRPVLSVHGTKGSFVKNGLDPQENKLKAGKSPINDKWGEEEVQFSPLVSLLNSDVFSESRVKCVNGSYQSYYKEVYNSIINYEKNPVEPIDALNTIKLIECAIESNKLKKWITLK